MRMLLALLFLSLLPAPLLAEVQVDSRFVESGPIIDGNSSDEVWQKARPVLISDQAAKETILLRSLHTAQRVYFLVQYPDKAENPLHKPWMWSDAESRYVQGPHREDTFVIKWSMMTKDVNLSNFSDDDYRSDVWYWKANRSNLAGFADDKMQVLSSRIARKEKGSEEARDARKLISISGKGRYLQRIPDAGTAPYRDEKPLEKSGPVINRFVPTQPSGSRADVRAIGHWSGGYWSVEFSRKLQTGHDDDVQFDLAKKYLFGVSIFSLYGNDLDDSSPNLYGMGRISEPLRLSFLH